MLHFYIRISYITKWIVEKLELKLSQNVLPQEYIQVYCKDQFLDPDIDVVTIKHEIWKSTEPMELFFN